MDTPQQETLAVSHLNRSLFSDHYLNEIVPTLPEWSDGTLFTSAKTAFEAIKALRETVKPETLDESQLEEAWIKPILGYLGHHYAVQVKLRYREKGHRKPDYVLFNTSEDVQAVTKEIYEPAQINHALAVADAKRWGVNLDQSAKEQRNPSQQIDEYLRYSELSWGVLTDGRYWRLYRRESSKYNHYYAVDLEALLVGDNIYAFFYFYAFFRREAFLSNGWLDKVLRGSEDFAQKLTDKLESEVFDALELIAQGFLEFRRNKLTADPATLKLIYEQSLVFLYRLLFVFYAESREILPLNQNEDYTRSLSLTAIKRAVETDIRFNRKQDVNGSTIYSRLNDLFFAIDSGNAVYDMPPYNGRLFSPEEHPFLDKKMVGNSYIAPALDKLARVDDNGKRVFVDYRDLDVRHLGSIYEKLLEYELDIAQVPLTLKGKDQRYVPAKEGNKVVKEAGQVYLRTGNNERKVTGSYYTPDYIVRFIVEKTIEPLLTEITEQHATLDEDGVWHVTDSAGLIQAVLALNVLDPATGSGHFVVDATAYIAEWLRALGLRTDDMGDEDELIYWKRQVASACIYAVDINPLAVELAKLSMWLTTLAQGKPLSFLDHHIRVGNSLVGTMISGLTDDDDVSVKAAEKRRKRIAKQQAQDEASGQALMFAEADFSDGVRFAVAQMNEIERTIADSVSDVKRQEQMYATLTERLGVWKQAADVWTARYFGLELTADEWKKVREFTTNGMPPRNVVKIVERAREMAEAQQFFHWDLAFPEIFFDGEGQPKADFGFDAVIGNPPYVRQERIQAIKPFLQSHYEVYSGTADLFLYFYERGIDFLKPEQRLGYITSGTYMNSNSAKPFRQYIHENVAFDTLVDFGAVQPFRGVDLPTNVMISILGKTDRRNIFRSLLIKGKKAPETLQITVQTEGFDTLPDITEYDEWRFVPAPITRLFKKMITEHNSLKQASKGRIYSGIKTSLTEAFVIKAQDKQSLIEKHPENTELLKSFTRGSDLRSWYQTNSGDYLVFTFNGIDISAYPTIENYLDKYKEQLMLRSEVVNGSSQWYELRPCSYYDEFDQPKIMWPDIQKFPRFSWDDTGSLINDKGFFVIPSSISTLALLNSRAIWFIISQIATPLAIRGGLWRYQSKIQFIERLPIPELTAGQERDLATIAETITGLSKTRYGVHEDMRQTIMSEFEGDAINTRVRLYEWWELADEKALSDEIKTRFKREIPLNKRGEWRKFLAEQKAEHQRLTESIVAQEIRLNDIVYDAFGLDAEERALIEKATKYPYGAV